jgi:hypothetical protein
MARDRSGGCDTGAFTYAKKSQALDAADPDKRESAKRCARCRQWHVVDARGKLVK